MDRNLATSALLELIPLVALRKESVDRNLKRLKLIWRYLTSLSARRAWIEISVYDVSLDYKEGRSPQGERG